jgi:hypothetical protein
MLIIDRMSWGAVGDRGLAGGAGLSVSRGHVYGTYWSTGRAVVRWNYWLTRDADTFADWMREHRRQDGVPCTRRCLRRRRPPSAPQAMQVADRRHLWHNLPQHVERRWLAIEATSVSLRPSARSPTAEPHLVQVAARRTEDSDLLKRTRQRYAALQALRAQGKGIKPIMRELGLAKETVRRFARAQSVEELLAKPCEGRPSILDPFKPCLHQRWNEGATYATRLVEEIRAQGHQGSAGIVRAYLRPRRAKGPRGDRLLLRHPDSL